MQALHVPEKREWPELLNVDGETAKQAILSENPTLQVHIIPEFSPVTMDYRVDRVRIFVNSSNLVSSVPRTG